MKQLLSAVVISSLTAGCVASPLTASSESVSVIRLSPSSGAIGTSVTIQGSGFTGSNTITFGAQDDARQQMPAEPGTIPNLSSVDGRTLGFSVPLIWRPACSYSPGPCPIANIPTAPGIYAVAVTNSNGTSNTLYFSVTR